MVINSVQVYKIHVQFCLQDHTCMKTCTIFCMCKMGLSLHSSSRHNSSTFKIIWATKITFFACNHIIPFLNRLHCFLLTGKVFISKSGSLCHLWKWLNWFASHLVLNMIPPSSHLINNTSASGYMGILQTLHGHGHY